MAQLVECVPNFSEGRRPEIIREILAQIVQVKGVKLLDHSSDPSHNRSVVTFLGDPQGVKEAAFQTVKKAAELIDLDQHQGEHPRMGATDVVPFIPVSGVSMEECVDMAREVGKRIGTELGIPVYLYEAAASRPERKNLAQVRKGQYEGLKTAIKEPDRHPDFGPAELPRAGATAVGARPPLVAYNINLDTDRVEIAQTIAKAIRGSSGGFPSIKALGIRIEETNRAQVTINVCNYREVPLHRVFEIVKTEAARYGVQVLNSEIVGLTPMEALIDAAGFYLRLENFAEKQILEKRIME
ncbi:glutamate formimidoyltransferase [Candidatus Formimonas warabiya]|uniref:glutamate formimidoyltransferase n=1 Tax=Formimonas warabiya TaxID=1761012 RepID=A0A3G1KRT8_FORW1|nr:glutamate formimidoyltransferase [Candidatus Formimonas warabiya]ATW25171.1 glutamate formimidoyltransferase [Candidatus Formimonas warabiya]